MKMISAHELHRRTEKELSALFGEISKGLVRTQRGSPERRNALATLENIAHARTQKMLECRAGP
jgi:hypothetical protein